MYGAEDARAMGLVDEVAAPDAVVPRALEIASDMAARDQAAYGAIKRLLRAPTLERIDRAEPASIARFVEIWYSPDTRERLKAIRIRE
jgi:enoyl-CoA hydratase/carnithine racemase